MAFPYEIIYPIFSKKIAVGRGTSLGKGGEIQRHPPFGTHTSRVKCHSERLFFSAKCAKEKG